MAATRLTFNRASAVISLIDQKSHDDYVRYWDAVVRPRTKLAAMRRWLFSFASVHTTYQANVALYNKLLTVRSDDVPLEQLESLVKQSGAGLHKIRSRGISQFIQDFWADDSLFCSKPADCDWVTYRNELVERLVGLGLAKTSFAIEMCWPIEAEVVCLDTHMLQLYGLGSGDKVSPKTYTEAETHWVETCKARDLRPTICRHVFWDRLQAQRSAHYWAHVFVN